MKLEQLHIEYDGMKRTLQFKKNTLIHSSENSVGKSTLLRLLFYSMGYNIPQTKGLKFKNIKTKLELSTPNGLTKIVRMNDIIRLHYEDNTSLEYYLPNDEELVLAELWNCKNTNVVKSIIGSIYMDQEKGWTLLNRGTVIGNIKFKIEDLLEGLSQRDLSSQKIKLDNINAEIKKYSQILSIVEYKNHLAQLNEDSIFNSDYVIQLENNLRLKKIKNSELDSKIYDLESSLKENNQFMKYIEKMKLIVRDRQTGIEIPVNEETLVHFNENQRYINARIAMLRKERSLREKEILNLILEIQKASNLFSLQSEIEKVDYLISKVNIPYEQIINTLASLKKSRTSLNAELKEKLSINNLILNDLHSNIMRYAKRLEIDSYINSNRNYVFTSDLKSLSGAVLHKVVFCFKMSYIIELQKYLGYELPIVLDSPSGREVDQQNVEEIFDLLNDDFSNNQIVVASIYQNNNFIPDETIELTHKIFYENYAN